MIKRRRTNVEHDKNEPVVPNQMCFDWNVLSIKRFINPAMWYHFCYSYVCYSDTHCITKTSYSGFTLGTPDLPTHTFSERN